MVPQRPLGADRTDANPRRARERDRRRQEYQRRQQRRRLVLPAAVLIGVIVIVAGAAAMSGGSDGAPTARIGKAGPGQGHVRGTHRGGSTARGTGATRTGSTVNPAATATGVPGTRTVPILMYHVINPPPAGALFPGLYVPAPEFADQMQALKGAGWHAVTMDQLQAYWTRGVPLGPGKPIVLSFDNGYDSQYTQAVPILQKLGWVGVENIQLEGLPKSQGGLTIDEVHGLINAGWELDTQGISHADLITLDHAQLTREIASARRRLQRRYHVPVNWFCYPSGHYNATVIAEVKAAGFIGATTVVPGWAAPGEDRYRLPRLRVLGGTSGSGLLRQLAQYEHATAPGPSYGGA